MRTRRPCSRPAYRPAAMLLAALLAGLAAGPVAAHDDPTRPIRMLIGIAPGVARPMILSEAMADKADAWHHITARYGQRDTPLRDLALWAYGDDQIRPQWDVFSASDAPRSTGFTKPVDTARMFRDQFETYVAERIIPPLRDA